MTVVDGFKALKVVFARRRRCLPGPACSCQLLQPCAATSNGSGLQGEMITMDVAAAVDTRCSRRPPLWPPLAFQHHSIEGASEAITGKHSYDYDNGENRKDSENTTYIQHCLLPTLHL